MTFIALAASATSFLAVLRFISTGPSNVSGVDFTLPSTSTVAVHSNRNGSALGLSYLIVTSPVSSFLESEYSTAECSEELIP